MGKSKKNNKNKIDEDEAWMYDEPASSKKPSPKKKAKSKNGGVDGLDAETRNRIEEEKLKLMESIGFYADSPIYNSYARLKQIEGDPPRSSGDFNFMYERLRLTAVAAPFYRVVMGLGEGAEYRDRVNRHKNDGRKVKTNEALERRGSF